MASYEFVNGQCLLHTGRSLPDLEGVGEMVDFYYGVITKEATQEDIDKLNASLYGERDVDGKIVATKDMADQLDEFEAFINEQAQADK